MQIFFKGDKHTFSTIDGSSCGSKDKLNILAVKKPTIPDKPKHIDIIRKKVWIKQKRVKTKDLIIQAPSKGQSNVSSKFLRQKMKKVLYLDFMISKYYSGFISVLIRENHFDYQSKVLFLFFLPPKFIFKSHSTKC
jgi:hypothetical protein